jgi:hypothetical protein
MNPRFLPFVPEDATLPTIYKKLLEGSEGVPTHLLIGVLRVIQARGVTATRKDLAELQDKESSWNSKFNALVNAYPQYAVTPEIIDYLDDLGSYLLSLKRYPNLYFPLVVAYVYATAGSEKQKTDLGTYSALALLDNLEQNLKGMKAAKLFSSSSENYHYFSTASQLSIYVFYQLHIANSPETKVKALYTLAVGEAL